MASQGPGAFWGWSPVRVAGTVSPHLQTDQSVACGSAICSCPGGRLDKVPPEPGSVAFLVGDPNLKELCDQRLNNHMLTQRNLIRRNRIHNVLQTLTDGGGGYTLGILEDCIIEENEIYSIHRPKDAVGTFANGIFCDNSSQGLTIRNNYIHDILNAAIRFLSDLERH